MFLRGRKSQVLVAGDNASLFRIWWYLTPFSWQPFLDSKVFFPYIVVGDIEEILLADLESLDFLQKIPHKELKEK